MNHRRIKNITLLAGLAVIAVLASSSFAQNRPEEPDARDRGRKTVPIQDEIPPSALLTDRGIQLADRLRQLRRSEATMGARHPSLPIVRQEIQDVKRELAAWSSESGRGQADAMADRLPTMNDADLRQVVLQLIGNVRQLERRIERLEQQLPLSP